MSNDTGFRTLGPKTPRYVNINSSEVSVEVVEESTGSRICVVSLVLSASGAGTVIFKSNSTHLGAVQFKTADPSLVLPRNSDGWVETAQSEKLVLGNASALTLTGFLTYILV